jgi:hypothetical protein
MSHLRGVGLRLPLIGGLLGLGGLIGMRMMRGGRRRPTASQLMKMDDATFAEFIRRTGLRTISSSRPSDLGRPGD